MSADATRVLLERLVDELDELERGLWAGPSLPHPALLREQAGEAMKLACAALDQSAEHSRRGSTTSSRT